MAAGKKLFDRRFTILVISQVIIFALLAVFYFNGGHTKPLQDRYSAKWRQIGAKLHSAGISEEAAKYYEKYLQSDLSSPQSKAKVAFSLGEIFSDLGKDKIALSWFYQVEIFDPKSPYKDEAAKNIVALLEKLKMFSAAKRELAEQTELSSDTQEIPQGAVEVARIEGKKYYQHQIQEALDSLPEHLRKAFSSEEGKGQFLQKFIADELLYRKAARLNFLDDPAIKKQLNSITKQLLIQKLVEDEIKSKVKVDDSDLKNYFSANQQNYIQPEMATISQIKIKNKKIAKQIVDQLEKGSSFEELVKKYSIDEMTKSSKGRLNEKVIAGKGFSNHHGKISETILKLSVGKWTQPLLSNGAYYIFKVVEKKEEKRPQFNEIKSQVTSDYQRQKSQSLYQNLIEETLASNDVKIFPERMK